ncbi:MAG: hypothetical protein ACI4VF_03305 [Lachnospirales bacterium]
MRSKFLPLALSVIISLTSAPIDLKASSCLSRFYSVDDTLA